MNTLRMLILASLAATGVSPAWASSVEPETRKVYCFAFGMAEGDKLLRLVTQRTLFVSPVFESIKDDIDLEVSYRESIPDAGLATCVSEEYEPDVAAAWQQFVDLSREGGGPVVIQPLPAE